MSGPAITVKDVWRGSLPAGTELIAGGAGLERRVEWACALRTRAPAFEAVKGGEVAFVPVSSIRLLDERLDLAQVMSSFAEKGGVAVAALGDVSAQSIDIADRLVMPLLRLPDSAHIAEAHQACVRFILDTRTRLHERAAELQSSLMQLALSGEGARGIVERVAEVTGLPSMWLDTEGAVRHVARDDLGFITAAVLDQAPALRRWADTSAVPMADPPVREFELALGGLAALVSPVPSRRGVGGFVAVIGSQSELDELCRLAVSRAAAACAIELDRERAVIETQERFEGEFIESLLRGTYASDLTASERARRLGVDIESGNAVCVLRAGQQSNPAWLEAAASSARSMLSRREVPALVAVHDHALCLIFAVGAEPEDIVVVRHADAVRDECARSVAPATVSMGVGRISKGVSGVRGSYREAEQALALGRRVLGPGRTVRFAELGLHRLLVAVAQNPELTAFYEQTVGPLLAYDARSGGGLMTTLDAFFACHGSPTETAHRLHLHRNTVLYRLRRIEEVGHLSLDDPATRLNLHLSLRIRDVLQVR